MRMVYIPFLSGKGGTVMFEHLNKEDKRTIRHRLGDYVAHKVIRNYGVMKSVEEINSLNRMVLARE